MVSLFSLFRWLGDHTGIQWLGTFKPLWVPAWFGSAFNVFLLRQFFLTIPRDLSEAARIDGCGELGIFFRMIWRHTGRANPPANPPSPSLHGAAAARGK